MVKTGRGEPTGFQAGHDERFPERQDHSERRFFSGWVRGSQVRSGARDGRDCRRNEGMVGNNRKQRRTAKGSGEYRCRFTPKPVTPEFIPRVPRLLWP
jgi:hypothetical protein